MGTPQQPPERVWADPAARPLLSMLDPLGFAPHSLRSGTSPHKLRGTSQAELREASSSLE